MKVSRFLFLVLVAMFMVSSPTLAQEVSEEAERYMFRGEAAMEDASDVAGYQKAVREFKRATELAPDWANAWFNLGVAQERAKDLRGAIKSYRKYMTLAPGAEDYDVVRKNVIKLEYRLEQVEKKDRERRKAESEKARMETFVTPFKGGWVYRFCMGKTGGGCNEKEADGSNWYATWIDNAMSVRQVTVFEFPGDGTVVIPHSSCGKIVGFPQGGSLSNARWEVWPKWPKTDQRRQVWSVTSNGYIKFSCDRPLNSSRYNRKTRYNYELWQKQ